eukprot:EG_transcript_9730
MAQSLQPGVRHHAMGSLSGRLPGAGQPPKAHGDHPLSRQQATLLDLVIPTGVPWPVVALLGAAVALFRSLTRRGEDSDQEEEALPYEPAFLAASTAAGVAAEVPTAAAAASPTAEAEALPLGNCYFETCVDCSRAWDKKQPAASIDEPWREPEHRYLDCGEDSFMCSPAVLAVADGVGGWTEMGVDPSLFANAMMKGVKRGAEEGLRDPVGLLRAAYTTTLQEVAMGSATVLVAVLREDGRLVTASLGDCGLLVIRGDKCVHYTKELLLAFNTPAQLTTDPFGQQKMSPEISLVDEFQTQPGDVVILSTDGLLDNLYVNEIVQLINAADRLPEQTAAQVLKAYAMNVTRDTERLTPFAFKARQAGYWYSGGKPDDITVVVGRVRQRPAL